MSSCTFSSFRFLPLRVAERYFESCGTLILEHPKHTYENVTFRKWPANLKCSHFWAFEWNDKRRRLRGSLWSEDGTAATGIKLKAEGVAMIDRPGVKAMAKNKHTKNNNFF